MFYRPRETGAFMLSRGLELGEREQPTPVHTGAHMSCTLMYMIDAMSHTTSQEITDTIHAIWTNRGHLGYTGDWLPLRAIRDRIASYQDTDWSRADIDAALADLLGSHSARIIPESNQKTLTDADRAAAIWLGGQHRHLISFAK